MLYAASLKTKEALLRMQDNSTKMDLSLFSPERDGQYRRSCYPQQEKEYDQDKLYEVQKAWTKNSGADNQQWSVPAMGQQISVLQDQKIL